MVKIRRISTVVVAALAHLLLVQTVWADDTYPSRPLRIITALPPGTAADVTLRRFAEGLTVSIGQPVVIENHVGGKGIPAAQTALASARDGYTLSMLTIVEAITKAEEQAKGTKLFAPLEEFDPLSGFETFSNVIAVSPASPFKTFSDILHYARENECALNVGVTGINTVNYLLAELVMYQTGVRFVIVPHTKVPDLLTDTIRGQVPVLIQPYAALQGQIDAGNLRPVAVTGTQREAYLPNIPTIAEMGIEGLKGFNLSTWTALYVPKGVPVERREYLSQKIGEVLRSPAIIQAFKELAIDPMPISAHEQDQLMHSEVKKWSEAFAEKKIYTMATWCVKK